MEWSKRVNTYDGCNHFVNTNNMVILPAKSNLLHLFANFFLLETLDSKLEGVAIEFTIYKYTSYILILFKITKRQDGIDWFW
jgi:hypothetical protein